MSEPIYPSSSKTYEHRGKLCLEFLDQVYWSITYGYTEPQVLRCSIKSVKMLFALLSPRLEEELGKLSFGPLNKKDQTSVSEKRFMFNNSVIVCPEDFPENVFEFETTVQQGYVSTARITVEQ